MIAFNAIGLGIVGIEVLIFLVTLPLRSWLLHQLTGGLKAGKW